MEGALAVRLLLKSRQAAEILSLSERTLWANTQPRGSIPVVRIGNCVRYAPRALERYIADQQSTAALEGGN